MILLSITTTNLRTVTLATRWPLGLLCLAHLVSPIYADELLSGRQQHIDNADDTLHLEKRRLPF